MSYIRCGISRWDLESNERVYESFGMSSTAEGVDCGVIEWVKHGTVRWYGYVMRINEDCFAKSV